MPKGKKNVTGMIMAMREQVIACREKELVRALEFRKSGDPRKCAYHLGLADGSNNVSRQLTDILNAASITEG